MAKRGVASYPQASTLARTFLKEEVHLTASRQFLTSEGLVVFAAEKEGMAAVAGQVWLRPSAYRRAGNYLDVRETPSVCGFSVARRPTRQTEIGRLPGDFFDQFAVAAQRTKNKIQDHEKSIELRHYERNAEEAWPWQATVHYQNLLKLADGHRIIADAAVSIYARPGARSDTVDVAVVMTRPGDLEVAIAWLARAVASTEGWQVSPVALNEESIVEELSELEQHLGEGLTEFLAWSNPHYDREIGFDSDADDEFVAGLRKATYDTEWYRLETVAERVTNDSAVITHLQAIIHERHNRKGPRRDDPEPVIALRLSQRRTASHLVMYWNVGRELAADQRQVPLVRQSWEDLRRLDWQPERKRAYVLRRWANVLSALAAVDEQAGESASSHSA